MSITSIKEGVSKLSTKEQASIAYWIINNLEVIEDEDLVEDAWRKEVRARVEAIKSGKVKMISAEDTWNDVLGNYVKKS